MMLHTTSGNDILTRKNTIFPERKKLPFSREKDSKYTYLMP